MTDNGRDGRGDELARRAQQVMIGLADTGLTQAEEMLRRVSPAGRAEAKRRREERRRRQQAAALRAITVALPIALVVGVLLALTPLRDAASLVAIVVFALVMLLVASRHGRAATPAVLAASDVRALPTETRRWLDAQRPALPAPALQLTDAIGQRLDGLAPQLARLPAGEPAGDAVRALLATELPHLVEGWQAVPPSLRAQPRSDGVSPDARLLDGLRLIDAELGRMTEQLARGALDEVSTQGRYLEAKYKPGELG